ncbi:MAG: LPS export ABC transporter periplasmic protein LptC [Magnetococcales bacterium]|nr:LPS export ABC transporter periplasmic protein LptC [Magnetococcales bacterium]MBF0419811.1 LPS export ABC transporter periplasmic protein LptC [Magnetococcales bacterium]
MANRKAGRVKYLFLSLALMILLGLGWYLWKPFAMTTGQVLLLKNGPQGAMVTDLSMVQFEGRETRWTLNARSAMRAKDDNVIIEAPHLEVHHGDGRTMEVTSREGAVNNETRAVIFHGAVEAKDGLTNKLTTNWLRFDPNERILYTDQAFKMLGENAQLEGVGFVLNQETRVLKVKSKVKVLFNGDRTREVGAWGS